MGTFGLGGLHRKSTWLPPVPTFAALPPTAVDGAVAVTLDTNIAYEYDAALPGWVPLTGGGPSPSFELREVTLTFSANVNTGVAINIQTGVYAGVGSPAAVDNDLNVTFPASGATFKDDGRIEVLINGQELSKGDGSGNGEAEWVSATQIKLNIKIKTAGQLIIRAPFPTA